MVYHPFMHMQPLLNGVCAISKTAMQSLTHTMNDTSEFSLARIEERPQTLRLIALDRVREAILEGRILPGERMVERTLSDRLGVSRSVIREVLRNLESEGLVETTGSGPRLATINRDEARQIYEIRGQLEASAFAACAAAKTPAIVEQLETALATIADAHAKGSTIDALRATTSFYETVFLAGGHTIAWEVVQRLYGRISRLRAMTLATDGRQAAGLEQLRLIVAAIARGDAAKAAEACRKHVAAAARIADRLLAGPEA